MRHDVQCNGRVALLENHGGNEKPQANLPNNNLVPVFDNRISEKRPLWNVNEVAKFLGVSERTVRDLVYKRKIPFRKVGRCVRFCSAEIEVWTLPSKE